MDIQKAIIVFVGGRMNVAHDDGSIGFFDLRSGEWSRKFGSNSHGYRRINIRGRNFPVHRIIAKAHLDDYSEDLQVDHINGSRPDNRIENLRMVTASQNNRARKRKSEGKSSEYRGVYWYKAGCKWHAQISINRKSEHLGYFDDEIDAAKAYDKAAIRHGFLNEAINIHN